MSDETIIGRPPTADEMPYDPSVAQAIPFPNMSACEIWTHHNCRSCRFNQECALVDSLLIAAALLGTIPESTAVHFGATVRHEVVNGKPLTFCKLPTTCPRRVV